MIDLSFSIKLQKKYLNVCGEHKTARNKNAPAKRADFFCSIRKFFVVFIEIIAL